MNRLFLSTIFTTAAFVTVLFLQRDVCAESSNIRSKNPVYRMDIEHRTGEIKFDGKQTMIIEGRPAEFTLKRGTAVELWITDNNPFLFEYQNEVRNEEFTQNYQAREAWLGALQARSSALPPGKKSKEEATTTDQKSNEEICKNILETREADRSKVIDMTIGMNGGLSRAITTMEEWKEIINADNCRLAADGDPDLKKRILSLEEFARTVYQVHSGKQLKDRIDITDSRKIYEATITVAKNGVYENLLSDNAKAARDAGAGTMKINFERKSNVRYAVSGGALYSFAKKPVINKIKKEGKDGKDDEYVWQLSDEYKGAGAAVTLNIIPEIFFEDSFEPFLQLGAAINGNDIGYLIGIGFSAFVFDVGDEVERSLTLSAGIIWQEVEKPNSKMRDGTTVEDHTTMGTMKEEYSDGFYVMLGINF